MGTAPASVPRRALSPEMGFWSEDCSRGSSFCGCSLGPGSDGGRREDDRRVGGRKVGGRKVGGRRAGVRRASVCVRRVLPRRARRAPPSGCGSETAASTCRAGRSLCGGNSGLLTVRVYRLSGHWARLRPAGSGIVKAAVVKFVYS